MNRTVGILCCVIAIFIGWQVVSRSAVESSIAAPPLAPAVEGSKIYFVPVGDFPANQLDPLVAYYRQKYGLDVGVLANARLDSAAWDASRQQFIAEKLVSALRTSLPKYAADRKAILIGFTSEDIYPASQNWEFAFGWREADGRVGVVSTARMNLQNENVAFSADVAATRLRKIVTKDIGVMYYGLPQSANPKSVLYKQILGTEELDAVGEEF